MLHWETFLLSAFFLFGCFVFAVLGLNKLIEWNLEAEHTKFRAQKNILGENGSTACFGSAEDSLLDCANLKYQITGIYCWKKAKHHSDSLIF